MMKPNILFNGLNCSFTIDENEVMGDSIMNKTIVTNIKL
jgi:hypothetical protein